MGTAVALAGLLALSGGIVFVLADERGSEQANRRGRLYRRVALGTLVAVVLLIAVGILRSGFPFY